MRSALIGGVLVAFSTATTAVPLSSWNLNLGTLGGSNATGITSVTVDGTSTIAQNITGNTAFGNPFTFNGSLALVQYQSGSSPNPLGFSLPAGYSDLRLEFFGVTGAVDAGGNGTFNFNADTASLALIDGSGLWNEVASFNLLSSSNALDIAYYDGLGGNAFYTLDFQLAWAANGLLTDDHGNPILPGAVFTVAVDGLLDWNRADNPYSVPGIDNTSFSDLLNTGEIGAVNVQSVPQNPVPEPDSLVLVAVGLVGMISLRTRLGS